MRPQLPAGPWRILWLAVAVAAALGTGAIPVKPLPPAHGEAVVGVAYRVELGCPEGFRLGDWLWRFDDVAQWPPPVDPNNLFMPRDPAPGTLAVRSATEGVFLADSNHEEYRVVRDRPTNGRDFLCPGV